jgi:hypothetical protein
MANSAVFEGSEITEKDDFIPYVVVFDAPLPTGSFVPPNLIS